MAFHPPSSILDPAASPPRCWYLPPSFGVDLGLHGSPAAERRRAWMEPPGPQMEALRSAAPRPAEVRAALPRVLPSLSLSQLRSRPREGD